MSLHILPAAPKKQNYLDRILGGISEGISSGTENVKNLHSNKIKSENELKNALELQKLRGDQDVYLQKLKGEQELGKQSKKIDQEKFQDEKTKKIISDLYGQKVADLYENATEGGKTKILEKLLESGQRGMTVDKYLGFQNPEDETNENSKIISNNKSIDFDKGLTPSERTRREEKRYTTNLPLFQQSQAKKQSLEMEAEELDVLDKLSPEINVLERLNINPMTGELLIPALASPETQRFQKTINDFTRLAKDSYGSRVTNFDLNQFMRRLPTLANSQEGREQIIKQMQLINKINNTYENNLHNVIDEYGGIRKIDYDKAQQMANDRSKKEISNLKAEFNKIGNISNKIYKKSIEDRKKITPKDHVAVEKSDGSQGYISKDKLNEFLKIPGNKVL